MNKCASPISLVLIAAVSLTACDKIGGAGSDSTSGASAAPSVAQTTQGGRDVERPDVFEVTDRGLWDGRPSLGGVWVAHPDAADPERVIIRNPANGRSVVGALFRRERENPGPLLQISSDAADELGILAGAPTELSVIAMRREEVEVPADEPATPEENPVVASLQSPVSVEAAPLDPIAGAAAAIDAAESVAAPIVAVALPSADLDADASDAPVIEAAPVLPAIAAEGEADLSGETYQIGVFSIESNATDAAQRLRDAGVPASVVTQEAGGRNVWRLVASPAEADADQDATLARIKDLGFADAFLVVEVSN